MRSVVPCFSALLLFAAASAGWAQVYRCGTTGVYTDKPCEGATAVDVRPNLLDAGPRQMPGAPPPAPAVIPPTPYDAPKPTQSTGSVWETRDAREAETRARTAPYQP